MPVLPEFPDGFRFGTGTSAYQVEGATGAGGRGASIWDVFSAKPGRIADNSTGSQAADHFHRYPEDLALLSQLGADSYRFSLAWSRIQPHGAGAPSAAGLDFYDRLIDGVLAAGAEPMVTLYHWDLPQALEDDGGWLNRATVDRFAEFAGLVGERYSDRVEHWIPINEPSVITHRGYVTGEHAPGRRLMFDALPVAHHLLLAHGRATIALRAAGATSVGCANNHSPMWPASDDEANVGATKLFDALWNGMFIEPLLLGRYPTDLAPLLEEFVRDGDLATVRQPLDFYGVNYYHPLRVAAADEDAEMPFEFWDLVGYPTTDLGWPVVPDAMREWLITLRARYRAALPPIVITASGCAYGAGPDEHGVVDDQARIDYHQAHLAAVATAIRRGVDIRGYYVWSLLDGFAWNHGLDARFGLVHVDHETQVRTPKRSFQWFADLIAAHARAAGPR